MSLDLRCVVFLTDQYNNPVSNATVILAPPSGDVASASLSETTVQTGADGKTAAVTATANTVAGAYNVTASIEGSSANPANFGLTNTPGSAANLTAQSGSTQTTVVGTAFAKPLVAKVTDSNGNPISGVVVSFAGPGSEASTNPATKTATTGNDGTASLSITANTVAGTYTVTASA